MVPNQAILPDTSEIRKDLEYMTARWHELPEPAVFEVRAFKEGAKPQIAKYAPDWMDDAVEWIESLNELGFNIYVVRNPIRETVQGSASDDDIIGSFFLWADCDDEASTNNVRRFDGPAWSASVKTGSIPSVRVHTYWALERPCYDLAEWRQAQQAIAHHFNSDTTVVNPSRIMRVGGTVAHPAQKKRDKGYETELTAITTEYSDTRAPISLDQARRVFIGNHTPETFKIDTGVQPSLDRERTAIQALSGNEWNHAVLRLVGSYIRKGLSDGEIHALTDPLTLAGYTVEQTRTEVQDMIDRTRANPKFDVEPEQPSKSFDIEPTAENGPAFAIQSAADFTADFVAPEYLIDGVVQRGRLYTLTAPTGSGKTAIMLHAAACMANGDSVCDRETEGGDVLYMAGENPDDVRARVIATLEQAKIPAAASRLHFIAGTFSLRQYMAQIHSALERLPNCNLVIIDTLAAYFDGDDANSNAQMLDFARVCRKITEGPNKPAVIMPAHPVKNAQKTNLTPMGGSALLNEVDGNLCLWKRETAVEMHWQGKHRGADFEPLNFELEGVKSERIKDSKGRLMPTVLAKPLMEVRALEIAQTSHSIKERLILSIESSDSLSVTQRCVDVGLLNAKGNAQKSTLVNRLSDLLDEGLAKRILNNWYLTDKGNKAAEIIHQGGSPVDLEA